MFILVIIYVDFNSLFICLKNCHYNFVNEEIKILFKVRLYKLICYLLAVTINKLTMAEAIAQSYVFFLGGFDSSSTVVTFALYELAQHQNLQVKVRKEIDDVLTKHDGLSYDVLNEMTYLHKVINGKYIKYQEYSAVHVRSNKWLV